MASILKILNEPGNMFLDKHLNDFADNSPEKKLLEVFCYGNYKDYLDLKGSLPQNLVLPDDSNAIAKLRKLTILTEIKRFIWIN